MAEPFAHSVVWNSFADDESLRRWLRCIRPHDLVQIIPMAHFQAWRNYVYHAEIVIDCVLQSVCSTPSVNTEVSENAMYRPLNLGVPGRFETRLVRILPGAADMELSCQIQHIALLGETTAEYEALSYCWGDTREMKSILLSFPDKNGQQLPPSPFRITLNLYSALIKMRSDDGKPRVIWIDALCINQMDIAERTQQVSIMSFIYASASRVVVWLGNCTEPVKRAFEKSKEIEDRHHTSPEDELLSHGLTDMMWRQETEALFQYEYFRRIWVLQETFSAKKIIVLCGEEMTEWSLVLRMNACLNRLLAGPRPRQITVMPALFADLFEVSTSDEQGSNGRQPTYRARLPRANILDTFIAGLDLDASDPRDKLFALFNLREGHHYGHQDMNDSIRPNYSKSTIQVFEDFTRWWIMTNKSLRILSAVHCSNGRTWQDFSLPSTVQRASWSLWYDGFSRWGRATLGLSSSSPYRASGATTPDDVLIQSTRQTLPLRGYVISTIAKIIAFPFLKSLERSNPALHHFAPVYDRLFDPILNHTDRSVSVDLGGIDHVGEGAMQHQDLVHDHLAAHRQYAIAMGGAIECHPRCFFETAEGAKGLCPATAWERDLIVVLLGGNVPYLLRPSSQDKGEYDAFETMDLVGECFLPGFMAGEALQDTNLESRIFHLT